MADATSTVQITNMALGILGDEPIAAMDQGTKASTLADSLFETERDATLCAFEWNFATKRASLGLLDDAPVYGYASAFQLESDCLKVLETYPATMYVIEGRTLLCDATTLSIKYTRQVVSPSEWSPLFKSAFAARLAWTMSYALTESVAVHDRLERRFLAILAEARSSDSQEGAVQSALGDGAYVLSDVRGGVADRSWYDDRRSDTRDFGLLGS